MEKKKIKQKTLLDYGLIFEGQTTLLDFYPDMFDEIKEEEE